MERKRYIIPIITVLVIALLFIPSCKKGGGGTKEEQKGPVKLDVKQENEFALVNNQGRMFIEMDLLSMVGSAGVRIPVNLSIVIDRSGSMLEAGKLEYVKQAVDYIIGKLDKNDTLSIVTYSDTVSTLVEQGPIISDKTIRDKLTMVMGGGWTDMSDGLEEAFRQVSRVSKEGQINRILLLSDGLANRGITDLMGLKKLASDMYKRDISISTIGVGANYDEEILRAISDGAGGNYYYISRPVEIPDIYAGELKSVVNTVAKDAKLSLRFTNGTRLIKVYGYDVQPVGYDMFTVDLGSLSAGVDRWVIMEIELPYLTKKDKVNLGSVWFGYKDMMAMGSPLVNYTRDINVKYTDDRKEVEKHRNIDVINVAMYIIAQGAKEEAQQFILRGDLLSAANILNEQNEMINKRYSDIGMSPPAPVSSEMAGVEEDANYLKEGASGGVSKDELSSKAKELDYESYKKTRQKEEIR